MYLILTNLIALAAAAPTPYGPFLSSTSNASILPRAAKCSTPGALLCHQSKMQGMCNIDHSVTWSPVAAGTICSCESGECSIVASDSSMPEDPSSSRTAPSTGTTPSASASPGFQTPTTLPNQSGTGHRPTSTPTSPSNSTSHNTSAPHHPRPSNSTNTAPPSEPAPTSPPVTGGSYKMYTGDGSVADGWPAQSDWLSFDALWKGYEPVIGKNCMTAFQVPNNTPEETAAIKTALLANAKQAGIPSEFAMAIMMQESLGCAHVPTTNFGVSNPGLFQDHDGAGTCFNKASCPASEINQMVKDGVQGTSVGPGLKQLVKQAGCSGVKTFYRAARMYNSGSIPASGDLGAPGATRCYCSDIANRLVGQWFTGDSTCTLD